MVDRPGLEKAFYEWEKGLAKLPCPADLEEAKLLYTWAASRLARTSGDLRVAVGTLKLHGIFDTFTAKRDEIWNRVQGSMEPESN